MVPLPLAIPTYLAAYVYVDLFEPLGLLHRTLALWLPLQGVFYMLMIMSVIGGVLTLIMMLDHWRRKVPGVVETPYGVAM